MANGTSSRFEKSPGLWVIIAAIAALNLWFDYYHPVWLFFDAIILIVLIMKWPRSPRNTEGRSGN